MAKLALHLLGPPRLERDGEPLQFDTRKIMALVAYLAVSSQEMEGAQNSRERHVRTTRCTRAKVAPLVETVKSWLSRTDCQRWSELDLHAVVGDLSARKDRIGAVQLRLAVLGAKRAEVNQDQTAHPGLGGQLRYRCNVAMANPSGEYSVPIQTTAVME